MMPSPTDAVIAGLRMSLSGTSKKHKTEFNGGTDGLDSSLAAGNKLADITKHHVEYEASENQHAVAQNALKAKYVVLDTKHSALHQNTNGTLVNGTNGGIANGNKFNISNSSPRVNGAKIIHQNGASSANGNGSAKNLFSIGSLNGTKKFGCNGVIKSASQGNIAENSSPKITPNNDSTLPEPKLVLYQPNKVTLGWQNHFRVGAGMVNLGNTCYLNATLQALFHVPAFAEWLMNDSEHMRKCEQERGSGFGDCITCSMSKTLRLSQNNSVVRPLLITNKIKMICRHMSHGSQEDAHEFMRHLLENMEKAYILRYKSLKLDAYSKETTPINQIFGGYIRTEVKCLRCNYASTTFQHFQDLILDIRKASKVEDAMDQYFSKEKLDGENSYKCEKCKCGVPATKKYSIERPPKVLCIQLKRFNAVGVKIPKPVEHRIQMDLKRHIHPQSSYAQYSSLPYRLISMVTHMGPSSGCGHYTAIAQCSSHSFHHFDDTHVHPVSLQAVLNTCAYILIYEMDPQALRQGNKPAAASSVTSVSALSQNSNHNIMNGSIKCSSLTAGGLPSAKDRDRVAFGLSSTKPVQPRIVIHGKRPECAIPSVPPKHPIQQNGVASKEAIPSNFIGPIQVTTNGKHSGSPVAKDRPPVGSLKPVVTVCHSSNDSQRKEISNSVKTNGAEKKHSGSLVPYDCDEDSSSRDSSLSPPCNEDQETLTVKATKPSDWQVTNSSGLRSPSIHSESSNHSVASATGSNWNVTENQSLTNTFIPKSAKLKDKKFKELSPPNISYSSDPELGSQAGETTGKSLLRAKSIERDTNLSSSSVPGRNPLQFKSSRSRKASPSSESESSSSFKILKKRAKIVETNYGKLPSQNGQSQSTENVQDIQPISVTNRASAGETNVMQSSEAPSSMWNGDSNSKTVSDLLKMSHQGFGCGRVTAWNGEQSYVDRSVEEDRKSSWKRSRDEYEMELDRGRVKKVKKDHNNRYRPYPQSFPNRHGGAPFNPNRKYINYNSHHNFKNRPNNFNRKWNTDSYKHSNYRYN